MVFIRQSPPVSPVSGDTTPLLTAHSRHKALAGPSTRPRPSRARGAQAPHRSSAHPLGEHPCPHQGRVRGALSSRPPPGPGPARYPHRPGPPRGGPLRLSASPVAPGPAQTGGTPVPGHRPGPAQPVRWPRAASSAPAGPYGPSPGRHLELQQLLGLLRRQLPLLRRRHFPAASDPPLRHSPELTSHHPHFRPASGRARAPARPR